MDNSLPRFDAFPSYVSCIKNYGRPILPPLLSSAQREEMAEIRHQAIIAEARIARRSIQKSSLMDKAKEIMEKIEKSQVNLLKERTEDKGSGDHLLPSVHQGPSNCVHSFPPSTDLSSPEQGDNIKNIPSSIRESNEEDTSVLSCSFSIQGTESCLSETEDSCSQSSACEYTSSQATFSRADGDSCMVVPSACDQNPILSTSDSFSESLPHSSFETSKFQSMCFPLDNSEGLEPNAVSSEGDEWVENGDSSSTHKTSDIDETENASMATVILRSCDELPNDTDSDSIITSAAQSTDLEKYFDSPGDCQFSESSEQVESCNQNDCSVRSISSDFESSATLVNSDAELTPVPCLDLSVTSRNSSRCESRKVAEPFASNSVRGSVYPEGKKSSGYRTHMRRSSYTLDKPSPALLQAFGSCPCDMNAVNTETSPYSNTDFPEKLSPQETVLHNSSFAHPVCLAGQISEANDQSYRKDSRECLSEVDRWAYKVTRDFCDNSELYDEASVRNVTCDTSGNLCDTETFDNNLYDQEIFSDNSNNTPEVFSSLSHPSNLSQTRTLGSAFETSASEPYSVGAKQLTGDFSHSLFPEKSDRIDENVLTRIFQNLQEFQRQQVEKLQEEQRQQWEKLHLEFQEQETILHEQLKSLYVSMPPDCSSKDGCHLETAETPMPTPDRCENASSFVINSQIPSVTTSYTAHSSQVCNRGDEKGYDNEINDPILKAKFDRVSAAVKGYLTRRLMKTERVQGIIQTIKDTLVCAVKFHEETPVRKGLITEQDADLHQRLISQITAACCELHDVFFKISTKERMLIISQSRELARERNKSVKEESNPTQKNSTFKRSPRSKTRPTLSSATIKYLERKNLRSSSEGKGLGVSTKGKTSSRAIPKRPASATGRRTVLSPTSLRSSKCTPYAKSNSSAKSSTKNAKIVRRLIYSRSDS